jgi:integrase/recombinase XerD
MIPPKVTIYFESRRPVVHAGVKNRCHIKIMLSYYDRGIRQRRYYKTNLFATADEFRKQQTGKYGKCDQDGKDFLDNLKTTLQALEIKANKCLSNFTTDEEFEKQFYSAGSFENPLEFMVAYADEMEQAGRIGNRDVILQAHSSFKKFSKGVLAFSQVTPKWLTRWENSMVEMERSLATVGMYGRVMRTIFNLARSDRFKTIPKDMYPFGMASKGKYPIPTGKGTKRALTEEQKNTILAFKTTNDDQRQAVDMWIFSYYANGMNFADIARLKFKDIHDELIIFSRAKTILTNRNQASIEVVINESIRSIINRWGNADQRTDNYVFGVLRPGLTASQVADKIHDFIQDTNDALKEACIKMELPAITTYWARHTHASVLRGKGVSVAQIQKNLGHNSIKTTESYLGSFDMESKKKVAGML